MASFHVGGMFHKLVAVLLIILHKDSCQSFIGPSSISSSPFLQQNINSNTDNSHSKIRSIGEKEEYVSRGSNLQLGKSSSDAVGDKEKKYKIQILMSDTGGGHRASANALRDAFDVLHPNKISVDIVDIYTEYGPYWPYNAYVPLYKIMAEYPILWQTFFYFGATDFGMWLNEVLLETSCFDSFKKCLERGADEGGRADMVVSVHPLCQDLPCKILSYLDSNGQTRDKEERVTPFVTVVTDLGGAHPSWFYPDVDQCFVPSDELYKLAEDRGLLSRQLVMHGLPVRKGFWSSSQSSSSQEKVNTNWFSNVLTSFTPSTTPPPTTDSIATLKQSLDLEVSIPTILIVGGGDGVGKIVDITTALTSKLSSLTSNRFQIVVVCGKNEKAQKELGDKQDDFSDNLNVIIKGFVYNMEDWMKCSDVLITKAGPGTIAEASICALPCMLSSFLPGQEEGNVPFVINNGFGDYSSDSTKIADTVSKWLRNDSNVLESMKEKALAVSRPNATLDIAKDLADIVFKHCDASYDDSR